MRLRLEARPEPSQRRGTAVAADRGARDTDHRLRSVHGAGQGSVRRIPRVLHQAGRQRLRRVRAAAEGEPADADRDRARRRLSRERVEHRRGGPAPARGGRGRRSCARVRSKRFGVAAARDDRRGRARRHGVGRDPRLAADALQRQRDPGLADAGLRCDLSAVMAGAWSVARSGGLQFPAIEAVPRRGAAACAGRRIARATPGLFVSLAVIAAGYVFMQRSLAGFQMRVAGLAPAAANYAGISAKRTIWLSMLVGGACAGIAGDSGSRRTRRATVADAFAGLRVRGDHRRVRRPTASGRHPVRKPADVAALPRRRIGAAQPGASVRRHRSVPGHAAVLPACSRCLHPLPVAVRARRSRTRKALARGRPEVA